MITPQGTERDEMSDIAAYLITALGKVRRAQRSRADGFPVSVSLSVRDADRLVKHLCALNVDALPMARDTEETKVIRPPSYETI